MKTVANPIKLNEVFELSVLGSYPKKRFLVTEEGKEYPMAGTDLGWGTLDQSYNCSINFYLMLENPSSKVALSLDNVGSVHFEKSLGHKNRNNGGWKFNSMVTFSDGKFYIDLPNGKAILKNITR